MREGEGKKIKNIIFENWEELEILNSETEKNWVLKIFQRRRWRKNRNFGTDWEREKLKLITIRLD